MLIGHARAEYGWNSNGLRETGAESKIQAFLIAAPSKLINLAWRREQTKLKLPAGLNG